MQTIRDQIKNIVQSIIPYDQIEKNHINNVVQRIDSWAELFRIQKDAVPPKHLVSYSVVIDKSKKKVLLFDHKKAQKLLPSGGHIDSNELPIDGAKRELKEELWLDLPILNNWNYEETPFFITVTDITWLSEPHVDVSLRYVFDWSIENTFDTSAKDFIDEFDWYHWLSYEEILQTSIDKVDVHMHRFINKLLEC